MTDNRIVAKSSFAHKLLLNQMSVQSSNSNGKVSKILKAAAWECAVKLSLTSVRYKSKCQVLKTLQ